MARRNTKVKQGSIYDPSVLLRKAWLRRGEAACLLKVSPRTIDLYLTHGKLDFRLTPGGHRRILTMSARQYSQRNEENTCADANPKTSQ